jgi:hypothetical protein
MRLSVARLHIHVPRPLLHLPFPVLFLVFGSLPRAPTESRPLQCSSHLAEVSLYLLPGTVLNGQGRL